MPYSLIRHGCLISWPQPLAIGILMGYLWDMKTPEAPPVMMPLEQLKLVIGARLLLKSEEITGDEARVASEHLASAVYAIVGYDPAFKSFSREDAALFTGILAEVLADASHGLYEAHFAAEGK